MSDSYKDLLEGNRQWVDAKLKAEPDFFSQLKKGQSPEYLWIGCSDSRVPANEITGTRSGEIFVHRNIANLVVHTDVNMLSVLQFAVDVLKVKHVIVCGHYDCGGVNAAMGRQSYGLIDNWLRNIKDVYRLYQNQLDAIENAEERRNRLVEFTILEQVNNLSKTSVVQEAWKRGDLPKLHGWVYNVADGILNQLYMIDKENHPVNEIYKLG